MLLFVALPFIAVNIIAKQFLPQTGARDLVNLVKTLTLAAAYAFYVRRWERRPVHEFALRDAPLQLLLGTLLGALLFSLVVAVLAALGVYSVEAVGPAIELRTVVASMLPRIAAGAFIEELVFRLLLLRLLERSFGTAWALLISSVLFGLAHLGNAGATPLVALALGLELGLLFGAAYLATRTLWLCAATHLAWNFMQGPVFGIAVSGQTGDTWLQGRLAGPAWLTGGAFGAEGSIVSVGLCLVAAAILMAFAHRRKRLADHARSRT